MNTKTRKRMQCDATGFIAASLAVTIWLASPAAARADEEYAQSRLKAMSDYMAAATALSFSYDATLEVVTTEDQKLALASMGTVTLNRPDRIRATRRGGSANVEMIFDGKTVTMFGPEANLYTQIPVEGTIETLFDTLRNEHGLMLPAVDLLAADSYDVLMTDVTDIKDIGSGFMGGMECDHFAFRAAEVDWQIWIAQGDEPYPCRYVITTKDMALSPEYSIQIMDWRTGDEVPADDFTFDNASNAEMTELGTLPISDLPENFTQGDAQ